MNSSKKAGGHTTYIMHETVTCLMVLTNEYETRPRYSLNVQTKATNHPRGIYLISRNLRSSSAPLVYFFLISISVRYILVSRSSSEHLSRLKHFGCRSNKALFLRKALTHPLLLCKSEGLEHGRMTLYLVARRHVIFSVPRPLSLPRAEASVLTPA